MTRRRQSSRYSYDGWAPYVPVAERRAKARREMAKLTKTGKDVQPVEIEGRTIARSFWGKGWCTHLEGFGDYSNRLPRGRTYVRNGSVCHLAIEKGKVEAVVSGSELYRVKVDITPLKETHWRTLKQQCTGKIGTLIELLQGKLSDEIMATVTNADRGLFPRSGEISYRCSCPDGARMCKHVSAVMYGIGARLDSRPELLFLLRGVDHNELINADAATDAIVGKGATRARRRALSGDALESVFGVELEESSGPLPTPVRRANTPKRKRPTPSRPNARPFTPTAASIKALRQRLDMEPGEFARAVGVSPLTIKNWEQATGPIRPRAKGLAGLTRLSRT